MTTHGGIYELTQALVDAVHRNDQLAVQRLLRRPDLPRLAVGLASRLEPTPRPLEPCGTRSAAERHIMRGELVDDECADARRAYYRERHLRQRALRAEGAAPSKPTVVVDEVAVERLAEGLPVEKPRRAERLAAVLLLHDRGYTRSEIAQRLTMSGGRVAQILHEQGRDSGVA